MTKIVTTPIYYVNASERFWKDLADNKDLIVIVEPHVGHLYSTVLADTIHRHFQFLGHQSLLTSGTDEHGQKIAIAATKASMTPAEYCDSMSSQFESLFAKSHISPSSFVFTRTSSPEHIKNVQTIWVRSSCSYLRIRSPLSLRTNY